MAVKDMNELLKHELGDLYFAEKHILKALKKMEKEVSDPTIREGIVRHQRETEQQITVLERVFEAIGEKAKAQKCPGILGIIEEHDEFKSEEEPSKPMLEAFALGSGLRVEHYEIAAYRTAISLCKVLGEREAADLLARNLEQEVAMEKFLTSNAANALRNAQAMNAENEEEGGSTGGARKRTAARRGGAKRASSRKRASA
jgi:ferritin-like metal-binding protein YciE